MTAHQLGRCWGPPPESEDYVVLVTLSDGSEREEIVRASSATNAACLARLLGAGAAVKSVWMNQ